MPVQSISRPYIRPHSNGPHVFDRARYHEGTVKELGLVVKAVSFGTALPVIAGFCGLRARGSSEGVGWATTAAVIGGSFAVIVLDFVLSAAALVVTGGDL